MPIETYEQAVAFWNSRINYEKIGMPQDVRLLKLDRMRLMLQILGNPHERYKIVHITGTKGKGSTATMIASVLHAAGYRTGLYTSPHLVHVEERIQVNGILIDREAMTRCMNQVADVCLEVENRGEMPPTFFEIITAVGLLHFAQSQVDWAVLEVGMGGRFDATNVVMPEVSVITSISLDHVEQLGNTLEKIALEKAGIIKPGVPVVTGKIAPGPAAVIVDVVRDLEAPLYRYGVEFDTSREVNLFTWGSRFTWSNIDGEQGNFMTCMLGSHQVSNAAIAIQVLKLLQVDLEKGVLELSLQLASIPGRLEILGRSPWKIIDAAHNGASIQMLLAWLDTLGSPKLNMLFAVSRDKQLREMLQLLVDKVDRIVFTRYASSSRGADPQQLLNIWQELGGTGGEVIEPATIGWTQLIQQAKETDVVVATGSVFLVGEIRQLYHPS